jgi:transposase-like protein
MSSRKKLKMVAVNMEVAAGEAARAGEASAGFPAAPDPEVRAVAKRRQFSAAYKLSVLAQVDGLTEPGAIGALLRREALYSSQLTGWRREREAGALLEALGRRRGRKARSSPEQKRVAALEARNARLERELEQARLIIEVQKKTVHATGAAHGRGQAHRERILSAVAELAPQIATRRVLRALGASHATWYRRRAPRSARLRSRAVPPPLALSAVERGAIVALLNSERFADATPCTAFARLLDEEDVPGLGAHHVPHPGGFEAEPRAAQSVDPPGARQTRAAGHRPQPGLVLGHHAAARIAQVGVLLPLRAHRHLQPLRGRLAGGER